MATVHDEFLRDAVSIDPLALNSEFIRLPADIAYWGERYASIFQEYSLLKAKRETLYSQLYVEIGWKIAERTGKKATVAEVEAEVTGDENYLNAKTAEIIAESEKVRLYNALEALRTKRDMLISLGAQIRLEQQNDPIIRERARQSRDLECAPPPLVSYKG